MPLTWVGWGSQDFKWELRLEFGCLDRTFSVALLRAKASVQAASP